MTRLSSILLALLITCFMGFKSQAAADFTANVGQVRMLGSHFETKEEPLFVFEGKRYDVYFFNSKISYVIKRTFQPDSKQKAKGVLTETSLFRFDMKISSQVGGCYVQGLNAEPVKKQFILENRTIKLSESFKQLLYTNVWPNIDLLFYEEGGMLEYDIICHSGAQPFQIKFEYMGVDNLMIDKNQLILSTPLGDFVEHMPETYQVEKGNKSYKKCAYRLDGNGVGFGVSDYDHSQDLVIDPWSTFIGGSDIEECYSVVVDQQGNTYASGYTGSLNFPITVGALQVLKQGLYDAFITKLDTTGNEIWSTFYGGIGDETTYEILVDDADNPYLIGYTNGNDLQVSSSGVFQSSSNGSYDSFILKLDSAGGFIWATYFGGSGGEFAICGSVDKSNNIVIAGFTSSTDMPLQGAFQGTMGGALDAFIAKFDSTGNLLWSTYCGGSNSEDAHSIHTDVQNNVIIAGETYSNDFPASPGAYQMNNAGNLDVFVSKYDSLGARIFSTYFGGMNAEDGNGITTDPSGNIYLVGYSESLDFPIIGSGIYQGSKSGGKDGFVAKFSPLGVPIKATFIGDTGEDRLMTVKFSSTGALYVAGYSNSSNLNMIGTPYQSSNNGSFDGFYYKMDGGLIPNYSTYIGGASVDYLQDMHVSSQNQILTFSGFSSSADFPTSLNVFQDTIAGQSDAFVFQSDSTTIITTFKNAFTIGSDVKVYPTFFQESVQLDLGDMQLKQCEVYLTDAMGRVVFRQQINQAKSVLQLKTTLNAGVYVLSIYNSGQPIKTKKLIKN